MSENMEEALRRHTFIHVMDLVFAGAGHCPGCQEQKEVYFRRRVTPGSKERCLDCWRAER